jgi:hypothetical protein
MELTALDRFAKNLREGESSVVSRTPDHVHTSGFKPAPEKDLKRDRSVIQGSHFPRSSISSSVRVMPFTSLCAMARPRACLAIAGLCEFCGFALHRLWPSSLVALDLRRGRVRALSPAGERRARRRMAR